MLLTSYSSTSYKQHFHNNSISNGGNNRTASSSTTEGIIISQHNVTTNESSSTFPSMDTHLIPSQNSSTTPTEDQNKSSSSSSGVVPVDGMKPEGEEKQEEAANAAGVTDTANTAASSVNTTTPTIVCQLSGEMGNNLGKFAQCYALSLWLQREYQLQTKIVIRHQLAGKWVRGRNDIHTCFPNLKHLDFEEGNTEEFDRKLRLQLDLFGSVFGTPAWAEDINKHMGQGDVNSLESFVIQYALNKFVNYSQPEQQQPLARYNNETISIPFLYGNYMVALDFYSDQYMDDYRKIFAFDHEACCKLKPDPDESVFHLRNFLVEMPRAGKKLGFEELGPEQLARDLFGHLNVGDKVAIISRFPEDKAEAYISALRNRGLQVRFVSGQTGVEDFCFLQSAQKEMVGIAMSTYFVWAGFLSNCSRVVAYSLNTIERQRSREHVFDHYNFTHPDLQKRFVFPLLTPGANATTR